MAKSFRTEIEVKRFPFSISYKSPTLFCGSCFTENIGQIMEQRKLPVLVNPFGVVYNPISIKLVLDRVIQGNNITEDDLNFGNGQWFSYLHHTSFSSPDKNSCLDRINQAVQDAHSFNNTIDYLLVTFGTARVYYLNETKQPVANCHKTPAKEFTNQLLNVGDIVTTWTDLIKNLLAKRSNLKIIFTISPVRHWKDGAIGNQQSKSILNVAVHELIQLFPNSAYYFPAYELLIDDLRDYRFYADDMLHPSSFAIEYIWDKFKGALIDQESTELMKSIEKINDAINHRPFNPNTNEHRTFVKNTLEQIKRIKEIDPKLNFLEEEEYLNRIL